MVVFSSPFFSSQVMVAVVRAGTWEVEVEEETEEEKKDVPEKAIKEGKKNMIFLYIFIVT